MAVWLLWGKVNLLTAPNQRFAAKKKEEGGDAIDEPPPVLAYVQATELLV